MLLVLFLCLSIDSVQAGVCCYVTFIRNVISCCSITVWTFLTWVDTRWANKDTQLHGVIGWLVHIAFSLSRTSLIVQR